MNDKDLDQQIKDLFKSLRNDDEQLTFDFDDNMNGYQAQPALTISSGSVDTISLGAVGSGYNFQYDYNNSINGGYNITTGSGGGGGGYTITTGTGIGNLSPNITLPNMTLGGAGQVITTGTNGITWSDWGNAYPSNTLQVKGDAEFDGDVKIKGKSLNETLEKIEEKLAILHPNEELESKWDELRELRNRYIELEKEIKEKEKMWEILKK
jgi:hypothetical protein